MKFPFYALCYIVPCILSYYNLFHLLCMLSCCTDIITCYTIVSHNPKNVAYDNLLYYYLGELVLFGVEKLILLGL
jgi:hypothetical protein